MSTAGKVIILGSNAKKKTLTDYLHPKVITIRTRRRTPENVTTSVIFGAYPLGAPHISGKLANIG
jgi:hypothetical protein